MNVESLKQWCNDVTENPLVGLILYLCVTVIVLLSQMFFAHRDLSILIPSFVFVLIQCMYSVRRPKE